MPSSCEGFEHVFTGKLRVEGIPPLIFSRQTCYSTESCHTQWQVFQNIPCTPVQTCCRETALHLCFAIYMHQVAGATVRTCHCFFCECACCPRHNHFISGSSLFSVCAGCFVLFFRPGPHAKTCSVSEPETERSCLEDACSSCSVPQPSFVWQCLWDHVRARYCCRDWRIS